MGKIPNLGDIPDYENEDPWCDNSKPVEPEVIIVNADIEEER